VRVQCSCAGMREGSELSQEFFPTAYRKRANSSIPRTSSQPSTAVFSPIPTRGKRSEGLDGMMMNSFFFEGARKGSQVKIIAEGCEEIEININTDAVMLMQIELVVVNCDSFFCVCINSLLAVWGSRRGEGFIANIH
jgi:hypothetical protein